MQWGIKVLQSLLFRAFVTGVKLESARPSRSSEEVLSRPVVDFSNVTRSDVKVCMWKPPKDAADAANGTAQMLLKLFEKRKQWTKSPLPSNFMSAYERTTYSLDCVYVSEIP